MTVGVFETSLAAADASLSLRIVRDGTGELHLGSPDDSSVIEQLFVYGLGEDADAADEFAHDLRAVGTGDIAGLECGWNDYAAAIGPVVTELRLLGGERVSVQTRDLHDAVVQYARFLRDIGA